MEAARDQLAEALYRKGIALAEIGSKVTTLLYVIVLFAWT